MMKQIFLLFVFFGSIAMTSTQAQSHAKVAAEKAAADASIIKKVDDATGEVRYMKKKVCPATGTVSYQPVEYCKYSKKFVNVPPRKCSRSKFKASERSAHATLVSHRALPKSVAHRAASAIANKKVKKAKAAHAANKVIKP